MNNLLDLLSCPLCFEVNGCGRKSCKKECLKACKQNAISLKDKKAIIDIKKCNSCSLCSLLCPVGAIDKVSLVASSSSLLFCPKCQKKFSYKKNVYRLLPEESKNTLESKFQTKKSKNNLVDWKFISYQYDVRYKKFLKITRPQIKNKLVIDVGCASAPLSQHFTNYVGLDNSVKQIEFAAKFIKKPILLADARFIPLKNNSVSYFISRNLLEHVKDEMKIILELRRVALSGGFFELPCSDQISWLLDPVNLFLKKIKHSKINAFTYGYGHINMLTLREWKSQIIRGGFKITEVWDVGNGLILNLVSFGESLLLSWRDNDFIPEKLVSKKFAYLFDKIYRVVDIIDPNICKSWSKIIFVKKDDS